MSGVGRLSHSTLNTLDICAKKIEWRKVQGIDAPPNVPMVAGIAAHAAFEAHEDERFLHAYSQGTVGHADGMPIDVCAGVAEDSVREELADWPELADEILEEAIDRAQDALVNWWNGEIPDDQPGAGSSLRDRVMSWRPLIVERYMGTWIPEHARLQFVGVPDCVYDTGAETIPVDWKTPGNWNRYRVGGEHQRAQACAYQWMLDRSPIVADAGTRVEFHCARRERSDHGAFQAARVIVVEPDEVDLDALLTRIEAADEQIAQGHFPKNPEHHLCAAQWCGWHIDNPHGPQVCDPSKVFEGVTA